MAEDKLERARRVCAELDWELHESPDFVPPITPDEQVWEPEGVWEPPNYYYDDLQPEPEPKP